MTQLIPLSQLKPSKLNVRKTGGKAVDDLAASIRSSGLQQNLGVVQVGKAFEVVFGGRRLRALQQLAKAGELPEALNDGIPCRVLQEGEAHEASLAENTVREAMHPLDQFSAFAAMAEAGKPTADIAAAFGVSDLVVRQRMKLARVSPKLLKLYGDGGMTLEQLQAFAVSDDHAAQEGVWKRAMSDGDWARDPARIRRSLTVDTLTSADPDVQLVGLHAYEAAGGRLKADLFSDTVQLLDPDVIERLVDAKLAEVVERVKAEGWSWVEIGDRPSWGARKIEPASDRVEDGECTDAEMTAMEEAEESGDSLAEDAIREACRTWAPGTKEQTGAVVCSFRGGIEVHRGMLRYGDPEPEAVDPDYGENMSQAAPAPKPEKDPCALPQRLVVDLTRIRTAELRLAMEAEPGKTIIAFTAHLAEGWRARYGQAKDAIGIHHTTGATVENAGWLAASDAWASTLSFKGPVLDWLRGKPYDYVERLLAFLVAESVSIVQSGPHQKGLGDELCAYFDLDMAERWRPSPSELRDMPKAAILKAVREACGKGADKKLESLKKDELAGRAAALLEGTTWLPECLRLPEPPKPAAKTKAAKGQKAAAGDA